MDPDGEKAEVVQDPTALMIWGEQTGGFTFSFFESDAKDEKEGIFLFVFTFSFHAV